jgi:hypothetical protein
LNDSVNMAIAKSAISPEGRKALANRANAGDVLAQTAGQSITMSFGELPNKDEDEFRESTFAPEDSSIRQPPTVSAYPPENLSSFLKALEASGKISNREAIAAWVEFWRSRSDPTAILNALRNLKKSEPFFKNFDELFDLQRELEGAAPAYATLVEGFRADYGWTHYWSDKERAKRRRNQLLQYYPDRKKQFLLDTLCGDGGQNDKKLGIGYINWVRLIEFFIQCGDVDTARKMVHQAVASACELESPLTLPVPTWTTFPADEQ